jgi:hypothetical protein
VGEATHVYRDPHWEVLVMKKSSRAIGRPASLSDLANVGPATLGDFRVLGIATIAQLAKQDAFKLHERLCERTGVRHDPCCIDVFLSAIDQARGGAPCPWWHFTEQRKQMLAGRSVAKRHRDAPAKLAK